MKHDRIIEKVFCIVFFLVCATHAAFARTLDVAELAYKRTREDHAFELYLKNSYDGVALSVSMTCPPPVTVPCASLVPVDDFAFGLVTSTCPGNITVVNLGDVITNQICANNYVVTRTYQATDACLNTATCTQVITVLDNTYPIITCPPNITLSCTEDTSPFNTGLATSTDNCDSSPNIAYADMLIPGSCTHGGSIQRTWATEDGCGNSSTCVQVITIVDIDPPIILSCPANVTISCSDDTSPANTGIATAIDNCDPNPAINFSDMFIPGLCTNSGTIQRTFIALDDCGNSSNCIQVITLEDSDPPAITCPPNVTISCADNTSPSNTGVATSIDNCDQNAAMTFSDNYIPGSCTSSGIIQRTFMTIDDCGNSSTCLQVISVVDNVPPVISNGPVDITVTATGPSPCSMYVSLSTPIGTDDCDPNVLLTNDYNFTADASDVYPEGSTLVTFTATDECGNTSTHFFMVVVNCQPPAPSGMVVHSNGNVDISGYLRLGEISEGAPAIKMKELPSTTTGSNSNSSVAIPHGLTASKIISVSVLVESSVDHFTPPEYSAALNLRYGYSVGPTDIVLQNNTPPGDCLICDKPAKVLIIYKE